MLIPIPDTSFVRDTTSMALINKDQNGLQEYMKKRNILAAQKDEINMMKADVNELKSDIQEIKQLLVQLIGQN
jgi:hypothetical protein